MVPLWLGSSEAFACASVLECPLTANAIVAYAAPMPTGAEIAVFVARRNGREVLLVHRAPSNGAYWHVVAGGVELGETAPQAAKRELHEETGLVAAVSGGVEVTEYAYRVTGEPAEQPSPDDESVMDVRVTCFCVTAADDWEPTLDWEHDNHRWCSPTEAFEALRWPGTAQALRKLTAIEQQ
jgi:8-oxo-dGTP pyrophosphatase MutT (NUDIX family)